MSCSRQLQRKNLKSQRKREQRMQEQQQLEIKSEPDTEEQLVKVEDNCEPVPETINDPKKYSSTQRVRKWRMQKKLKELAEAGIDITQFSSLPKKRAPKTSTERSRIYRMRKKLEAQGEAEGNCEFVPYLKPPDESEVHYECLPNECVDGGTFQDPLPILKQEPKDQCSGDPWVDSESFCASHAMEPVPSFSGVPIKEEPKPELTTPTLDGFFGVGGALWDSLQNVPDPAPEPDQDRLPRGRKNPTVTLDSIKKELTHVCELCGKRFRKSADFFQHKLTHGDELKCGDCDERFFKSWDLEKHRIEKHSDAEMYKCETCSKVFIEHWRLVRHQRTHSTEKKFKCDACDKTFTESGNLAKHKKQVHTKDRPFTCEVCSKSYPQKKDLQGHMLVHAVKRFSCPICSEEFSMLDEKRKHVREVHPNEPTERCFTCTVCEATFNSKLKHSNHVLTHGERRFECQVCLKKFHTNARVRKHMNSHRVENHSRCPICDKSFSQDCNMKRHIEQMHMQGDKYCCQHCASLFESADELRLHRDQEHQNELPYKCPACPKAFSCHQSLVNHTRCHNNPKRHLKEFIKPTPRKRKQPKTATEGEEKEVKMRGRPRKLAAEATVTTSSGMTEPEGAAPIETMVLPVETVSVKVEVDHFEEQEDLLTAPNRTDPIETVMIPMERVPIRVECNNLDGSELLSEIKIEDTGFNETTVEEDYMCS